MSLSSNVVTAMQPRCKQTCNCTSAASKKSLHLQIGYQFVMRWVNNHIYFMKQRSPLGRRILEQVRQLPFENSDKFKVEVINNTCKPKGYFPVTDPHQFRDFYNFCVFNLIKASEENKGDDLDNVLFDQPLVRLPVLQRHRMPESQGFCISKVPCLWACAIVLLH